MKEWEPTDPTGQCSALDGVGRPAGGVPKGVAVGQTVYLSPARSGPPRLLYQVRIALRARHYSARTEATYVAWIRRFIVFHGKRHPKEMGEAEINSFLSHLATRDRRSRGGSLAGAAFGTGGRDEVSATPSVSSDVETAFGATALAYHSRIS